MLLVVSLRGRYSEPSSCILTRSFRSTLQLKGYINKVAPTRICFWLYRSSYHRTATAYTISSTIQSARPDRLTYSNHLYSRSSSSMSSDNSDKKGDSTVDNLTENINKISLTEVKSSENDQKNKAHASDETKKDNQASSVDPKFHKVAEWLQEGSILVLTGAGVSVSAGIPDFRTPGTGLYDNLQKYNLPHPEAVFDLDFYVRNPQPFVSLASELWPATKGFSPTLTHCFVALLQDKGLLLRNYSQNIDGLENLAGVNDEHLLECHGHFRSARCCACGRAADIEKVRDSILEKKTAPTCTKCNRYIKPDIVFFGENLPARFHRQLPVDVKKARVCLVLGTSLQVMPVAGIPDLVQPSCKRILVNRDLVGSFSRSKFGSQHREAFLQGDCDDNVEKLAIALGWHDELLEKMEKLGNRSKQI